MPRGKWSRIFYGLECTELSESTELSDDNTRSDPTPEVRLAVTGLLAEYCSTLDSGEFDAWTDLFAVDGSMELDGFSIVGHEKLRRFAARSPRGIHVSGLPFITLVDGAIRSVCSWVFIERETGAQMAGYYRDHIVWAQGRHRFTSRQIEMSVTG
jgi:hypothetical protein